MGEVQVNEAWPVLKSMADAMHECGVKRIYTNTLGIVLARLKKKFGDNIIFSAQFSDNGSDAEDEDYTILETYNGSYENIISLTWWDEYSNL